MTVLWRTLACAAVFAAALTAACGGGQGEREEPPVARSAAERGETEEDALEEGDVITFDVTGSFKAPDSNSFRARAEFGGISFSQQYVIIGESAWTRLGRGAWRATPTDDPEIADDLDISPGDYAFWTDFDMAELEGFEGETTELNGVKVRHLVFDNEDIALLASVFQDELPQGLQELAFEVWLAEEGWPVRLTFHGKGDASFLDEGDDDSNQHAVTRSSTPVGILDSFSYTFSLKLVTPPQAIFEPTGDLANLGEIKFSLELEIDDINEPVVISPPDL